MSGKGKGFQQQSRVPSQKKHRTKQRLAGSEEERRPMLLCARNALSWDNINRDLRAAEKQILSG